MTMNDVKFGIRIPAFPVNNSRGGRFRNEIANYLKALDGRFASVWVADHFVPWESALDPMIDTLECWTTLVYLAGKFPGHDFGTMVMSQSYRQPALVAKMSATLQLLTEGRFILGIGAGWKRDEYLAYGYEFPPAATRIHQMGEAVRIIKAMWTEPKANFQGSHYHVEDAINDPKPNPLPPILIGGGGKKITLRYVAQYADWWNFPGGSPKKYAELLEALRGHCETVGRDYNSIVKSWTTECVAVADTHDAAVKMAQASPLNYPDSAVIGTPDEGRSPVTALRRYGL